MPIKALHPCNWMPRCGKITSERFCPQHQREYDAKYNEGRGTTAERGYDANWQRLRSMKLAENPMCERCLSAGKLIPAFLVHHKDRNTRNLEWSNL